jgi:hypothetical protein
MAFIRKRLSSMHRLYGTIYSYQLIETYRDGGRVKQRVLANLGGAETVTEALEWAKEDIQRTRTMPWFGKITREKREEAMRYRAEAIAASEAQIALLESLLSRFNLGAGPQVSAQLDEKSSVKETS